MPARLKEHEAAARLALRLTRLADDMDLVGAVTDLALQAPADDLDTIFESFGFGQKLLARAQKVLGQGDTGL